MTKILPSKDDQIPTIRKKIQLNSTIKKQWSPWHKHLHEQITGNKKLLPDKGKFVLAISGGQDSMALAKLLRDLQHIHTWELHLWHGNHRWRPDSDKVTNELARWAAEEKLNFHSNFPDEVLSSESMARQWRYNCLISQAIRLGCQKIITAHTASDRAETLLLNIARGSDRQGMASLPNNRNFFLKKEISLVRPFLNFSRKDTAAICQEWKLPIWYDYTNDNLAFSRNRIRHQVLPILEELHPGANLRMSALSSRLQQENQILLELLPLAMESLTEGNLKQQLIRTKLVALSKNNQRNVLRQWILEKCNQTIKASVLQKLICRLPLHKGPGQLCLEKGWILSWNREYLELNTRSGLTTRIIHQDKIL